MALRPNLVLTICCLSLLMVSMDATIVNVALRRYVGPTVGDRCLHARGGEPAHARRLARSGGWSWPPA